MSWFRSLLALLLFVSAASAGDWPQWLGPTRDGATVERFFPWQQPPRVVWHMPVGEGHSSPIVAGGRVFLHAKVKDKEEEELSAYEAATGKPLWSTSYPRAAFQSPFGNGPRATPCLADGKIYSFGATGVLSCFETGAGKQIWQVDTLAKFQTPNLTFGVSCSPLLEDNKVLVMVGKGTAVVAFDKDKGEVVWKNLEDPASYSSPIAFGKEKERQVVFLTQQGLVALNPADGSVYWKYPLVDLLSESSTTPVCTGDLLLASSVTVGSAGLRLSSKDGKPTREQAWKNASLTCYFSTPVPVGNDHIYMVTGAILPPQATLRCVETKTGKELWHKDRVGKYHAALVRTGDDKLLMLDDGGGLTLLEPNPRDYRELARSKVCGTTWAHPAIANGKIYLRDEKELICLEPGR